MGALTLMLFNTETTSYRQFQRFLKSAAASMIGQQAVQERASKPVSCSLMSSTKIQQRHARLGKNQVAACDY
jgi:hypothetical protein